MTRQKVGDWLSGALKVMTIFGLLGSPIAAYIGASVKVGVIEYKLDVYIQEQRELRKEQRELMRSTRDLSLAVIDLRAVDLKLASDIEALKLRSR